MRLIHGVLVALVVVSFLLWFWPNAVHEPVHLLALRVQGLDGVISADWSHWPAHPSVTPSSKASSVGGALLYYLLPSLVSCVVLCCLWFFVRPHVVTHVGLATYLLFDLVLNVVRHSHATSDFHWLSAVPLWTVCVYGVISVLFVWHARVCSLMPEYLNS
jgi:hypothetical protein